MFGIRTPIKRPVGENRSPQDLVSDRSVRRSIGEWEAVNPDNTSATIQAGPSKQKKADDLKPAPSKNILKTPTSPKKKYSSRTAEARACLLRAKEHLKNSRNLKTEIKESVTEAIIRLYELTKEAEIELGRTKTRTDKPAIKNAELETTLTNTPAYLTINKYLLIKKT